VRRLAVGWRPVIASGVEEAARDCLTRAQSALLDEHLGGAQRQLLELFDLLVAPIDGWLLAQSTGPSDEAPLSVASGLLGLWDELLDLDVERESAEELLIWHAGNALPDEATASWVPIEGPVSAVARRAELAALLDERLQRCGPPRSDWWRRLARGAVGSLEDRGHITIQRQSQVVAERQPLPTPAGPDEASWATELGPLTDGDRLILRWSMPLPGQLAIVHAVGAAGAATLSLLLPQSDSEAVARRAHELVEVVGEVAAVEGAPEHSLVVIWAPELLPPSWPAELLHRRRVPPESRLWRYRYRVPTAQDGG
jgi:hypothetical protein